MPNAHAINQDFLNKLDQDLWRAADTLRKNLDAANYKHIVLGFIFLKYISDSFNDFRQKHALNLTNPDSETYLDPALFDEAEYQQILNDELEERDYYTAENIFYVPQQARWENIKDNSKLNAGDELPWGGKFKNVSILLDDAFEAIEQENPKLKGVLQRIAGFGVPDEMLRGLIDLFSRTDFTRPMHNGEPVHLQAKDILGHVYEYFLGQFALAEGKKGGQYFTPKSIVTLIVEMLEPYSGRVYDPAMGSGGFLCKPTALSKLTKATATPFRCMGKNPTPPPENLP